MKRNTILQAVMISLFLGGFIISGFVISELTNDDLVTQEEMTFEPQLNVQTEPVQEPETAQPTVVQVLDKDGSVIDIGAFIKEQSDILKDETLNKRQKFALLTNLEATWEDKKVLAHVKFEDFNRDDAMFAYKDSFINVRCMNISEDNDISKLSPNEMVWVSGDFVGYFLDVKLDNCQLK